MIKIRYHVGDYIRKRGCIGRIVSLTGYSPRDWSLDLIYSVEAMPNIIAGTPLHGLVRLTTCMSFAEVSKYFEPANAEDFHKVLKYLRMSEAAAAAILNPQPETSTNQ